MDQDITHTHSNPPADEQQITRLLQGVWERVRQAGDLITELRSQKADLVRRMETLERDFYRLKGELSTRDDIIKTLTENVAEAAQGKGFTNGERDAIATRVKELLARIEGYL